MIYEGAPSSHLPAVAAALLERLRANYRCLYLNSAPMVAGMRWHLAAAGLDLEAEVRRGALVFSSEQTHLVEGKFETERMLVSLGDAVRQVLADGYEGLWASGDMTWEFGAEENLEKLLDYERQLDAFMKTTPGLCGICLYHRNTLPSHAIQSALKTHESVRVNATLIELNPLYL